MLKKVSVLLVVALLLVSLSVSASAVMDYEAISLLTADCETSGGTATCSVTFRLYDTYEYDVELWLQRSSDGGRTYRDYVRVLNISGIDDGSVEYVASRSSLSNSYIYATKALVTVYDSNGDILDKATAYSY